MSNIYSNLVMETESDVEQKFVYPFLIKASPEGLGYRVMLPKKSGV